jgi:Bacterial Ig-like domain
MRSRRKRIRPFGTFDHLEGRRLLTLTMTPLKITAAQGSDFSGVVAVLADTTLGASPSNFNNPPGSVQINWGDGQTSAGTVIGPVTLPGAFEVTGSHTYAQPGSYSVNVNVADTKGGDASALSSATVSAQPFVIAVNTISGAPGSALPASGNVATFITPNAADNVPSDFSALINWGDGQTTIGTIGGGPLTYTVTGSHTYAASGTFSTSVTVTAMNGPTSTGVGQANIAPPPVFTSTSKLIVVPASQLFSGIVTTFLDPNTSDLASIFTASIAWGDGNTTPASVTGSYGSFAVQGMYTYLRAGTYAVTVTVADQSGNTFTVKDTANVTSTDLSNSAVYLTGGLADLSSNGPNAANGYTNTDEPTFSGTTVPYSIVALSAQLSGVDVALPLGQAVATAGGQWNLKSGPLANGLYTITATVTPPAGFPTSTIPLTNNGQIVIDTVSPIVVGESVVGPGRVKVSFRDDLSGMNTTSLLYADNYTFAGPGVIALHPNKVSLLPSGNLPTDARGVLLTIKVKRRLLDRIRDLRISGTNNVSVGPDVTVNEGIIDNAGNVLAGNFHIKASPASGRAAGNYLVKVTFRGSV